MEWREITHLIILKNLLQIPDISVRLDDQACNAHYAYANHQSSQQGTSEQSPSRPRREVGWAAPYPPQYVDVVRHQEHTDGYMRIEGQGNQQREQQPIVDTLTLQSVYQSDATR